MLTKPPEDLYNNSVEFQELSLPIAWIASKAP
jgi:hypothetical protein